MQLRTSPGGDHAHVLPQPPRRAAVVGDGHDRRQVVGVLLEAAQQDRQPRAAADRHDARPAAREAVPVDHVDEAFALAVAVAARQRAHRGQQAGAELPHPHDHEQHRHADEQHAAQHLRDELQGDVVERVGQGQGEVGLTRQERHPQPQKRHAQEEEEEPALHAHAGQKPLPRIRVAEPYHCCALYDRAADTTTGPPSRRGRHRADDGRPPTMTPRPSIGFPAGRRRSISPPAAPAGCPSPAWGSRGRASRASPGPSGT